MSPVRKRAGAAIKRSGNSCRQDAEIPESEEYFDLARAVLHLSLVKKKRRRTLPSSAPDSQPSDRETFGGGG